MISLRPDDKPGFGRCYRNNAFRSSGQAERGYKKIDNRSATAKQILQIIDLQTLEKAAKNKTQTCHSYPCSSKPCNVQDRLPRVSGYPSFSFKIQTTPSPELSNSQRTLNTFLPQPNPPQLS